MRTDPSQQPCLQAPILPPAAAVLIGLPPTQATSPGDDALLRGLVRWAIESGSGAAMSEHDVLRNLEADVLDRWRRAMVAQDAADVVRLVEIGHVVSKALHATPVVA